MRRVAGPPAWLCWALALLVAAGAWGAHRLASQVLQLPPAETAALAADVPTAFRGWRLLADQVAQVGTNPRPDEISPSEPYTEQLLRTYGDDGGRVVMLTLAYAAQQTPFTRPHLPVDCYVAAGFDIQSLQSSRLTALETAEEAQPLITQRMLAQRGMRREAVVYWIRIGDRYSPTSLASRWHLAQAGLRNETQDGILVRASLLLGPDEPAEPAYAVLEGFLADLLAASPEAARQKMRRS